jgi:hypothetical protein
MIGKKRLVDHVAPVLLESLNHCLPRLPLRKRLEILALYEDQEVLELVEAFTFDRLEDTRPHEWERIWWEEIE